MPPMVAMQSFGKDMQHHVKTHWNVVAIARLAPTCATIMALHRRSTLCAKR
jgi:hypothetical protein